MSSTCGPLGNSLIGRSDTKDKAGAGVVLYSCEICGQDGLAEDELRTHMELTHIKGAVQCPFCDLKDITAQEMTLHVNCVHLEYITPENEDKEFLEYDFDDDMDSIFQLEQNAKEGITSGVDRSPIDKSSNLNLSRPSTSNSFISSMSTSTETSDTSMISQQRMSTQTLNADSETAASSCSSLNSSPGRHHSNNGAIQKRPRSLLENNNHRSKASLTLNVKSRNLPARSSSEKRLQRNRNDNHVLLPCPMCEHKEADPIALQEHVNRAHFDLASPAVTTYCSASTLEARANSLPLPCPLCTSTFPTARTLETHVNTDHADVLNPTKKSKELREKDRQNGNTEDSQCPVCQEKGFSNFNHLAKHIENHFNPTWAESERQKSKESSKRSRSSGPDLEQDRLLAEKIDYQEREKRKLEEEKGFNQLRSQYGLDNDGNFKTQSLIGMEKAVRKGQLSVVDYYEKEVEMKENGHLGRDDGKSCTKNVLPLLESLSTSSYGVRKTYLCSPVDHYAAAYGDRGWGCGYRNFQMLLSALCRNTSYSEKLPGCSPTHMYSIDKLQILIERAWSLGFDLSGREQLGGALKNSRKWIGATEIVASLTALGIKTELADFHKPSAQDGSHPMLYNWVVDYFRRRSGKFTPPLYFQHQGHSRTIVGVEILKNNALRLLVLDPSNTRMADLFRRKDNNAIQVLKSIRKHPAAIKSKQYQIVAVTGILASEDEVQARKVIASQRIP
ncbi:zinc finger-containing ubiquitin peptidase 1-like [Tigriopus californicus]|uniref:zinc finger-containing ubiquitin peptidase 1-like n=1 Tax=Tigriopus californicus TaxID=6832 RepID=UPI0027D9D490|nr:zinc finger-containing ubiquitin peptidase 1-like [Tigriopus californicus]